MTLRIHTLLIAGVVVLIAGAAAGQTANDLPQATRTGQEVSGSVGHYTYIEPGSLRISIHGAKFGGEYTGTWRPAARWFVQANGRGIGGSTTYDGWCLPFVITPDSRSPNGYALGLGDASPCSESGDADWYVDGRTLLGRDFLSGTWGLSPATGLGLRYLSNGIGGTSGYRIDRYLYLPLAVTARRRVASHGVLSLKAEYDALLRGWQTTKQSLLGGGEVPATPIAPAFTVEGFTDLSFVQRQGWAVRLGAKYELTPHWSIEPSYIHWQVSASSVDSTTATYTVNGITADEELNAIEPDNTTHEFSVSIGFHF